MSEDELSQRELFGDYRLRGELAATLLKHAKARSKDPCELFADIVEAVLKEDLIDAILDDRQPEGKRERERSGHEEGA